MSPSRIIPVTRNKAHGEKSLKLGDPLEVASDSGDEFARECWYLKGMKRGEYCFHFGHQRNSGRDSGWSGERDEEANWVFI